MPPVVCPDLPEHILHLVLRERLLEEHPGGEGVAVEAPGFEDGVALFDELGGSVGFSVFHEGFGQVDREEDELVAEVSGSEFFPELLEDAFGFRGAPRLEAIRSSCLSRESTPPLVAGRQIELRSAATLSMVDGVAREG